jgi:excinuclease UvrABC ATPase subunit
VTSRLFSFDTPVGACSRCGVLGGTAEVDPEKVVPDPSRSLRGGALAPSATAHAEKHDVRITESENPVARLLQSLIRTKMKYLRVSPSGEDAAMRRLDGPSPAVVRGDSVETVDAENLKLLT